MSGGPRYVKDFEFPTSAGFTGSATDRSTVPVRAHERQRFAKGGKVMAKPALGSKTSRRLSTTDTVRGGARRRQERALGLFKGGMVEGNDRGLVSRNPPVAEEEQGTSPLRRGYKKGGRMKMKAGLAQACGPMMKKAMGGPVAAKGGGSVVKGHMKRSIPHQSAYENTKHSHLAKGGRRRYNGGGEVENGDEGEEGEMREVAQEVVAAHVAHPAPKGHKGLRAAKGGFQRTPMYGK